MKRNIVYLVVISFVLIVSLNIEYIMNFNPFDIVKNEMYEKGGVHFVFSCDSNQENVPSNQDFKMAAQMIDTYLSEMGYKTKKVSIEKSNYIVVDIVNQGSLFSDSVIKVVDKICIGNVSTSDDTEKSKFLPFKLKVAEIRNIFPRKVRERYTD